MKKIYLLLLALSLSGLLFSQSISRSVIASAGDFYSNGTISVSWTLGEIATETYTVGNVVLTQGFQQPDTIKGGSNFVKGFPNVDFTVKVYPNPAEDYLNVVLSGNDNLDLQVSLFDAIGRNLLINRINAGEPEKTLDVSAYRPGIYFLKIATLDGRAIRTFQVTKVK